MEVRVPHNWYPTVIANGNIKINISTFEYTFSGGVAISSRVNLARAWVKYDYTIIDTGIMYVFATLAGAGVGGSDSIVGQGQLEIHKNTTFTKVEAPITYIDPTVIPNRLVVAFSASNEIMGGPNGTTLYVDDVSYADPTGIEHALFNHPDVSVFPNPVVNELFIDASKLSGSFVAKVYDQSGRLVTSRELSSRISISTVSMSCGTYILVLEDKQDRKPVYTSSFVKQ